MNQTSPRMEFVASLFEMLSNNKRAMHVAVAGDASVRTYQDLLERSVWIAAALREAALPAGRPIGVALGQGFEYIASILGVLWSGRTFLPVDPAYPPQRIAHMMRDSDASCLLHDARLSTDARCGLTTRLIELCKETPAPTTSLELVASDQPVYTIYTSGTTGLPKGVPILAEGLKHFLVTQGKYLEVSDASVFAAISSVSFDMSIWETFLPLFHGGSIATFDRATIIDGRSLGDALVRCHVTHLLMTPSMLSILPRIDYPDMRHVVSAGEKCPPSLTGFWASTCSFHDAYGATEATIYTTITRKTAGTPAANVGRPMDGNEIAIMSDERKVLAAGETGEIWIGGIGVSPGYHNRPDLNSARFVWQGETFYYRTGDMGLMTSTGELHFKGRMDKQIKLNGFRIELEEIEAVGHRTGLLDMCHAVVSPGPQGDLATLILFAVPRRESSFTSAVLKQRLRDFLPTYMVPSRIIPVSELPITVNGKVDSAALLSTLQ